MRREAADLAAENGRSRNASGMLGPEVCIIEYACGLVSIDHLWITIPFFLTFPPCLCSREWSRHGV